MFRSKKRIRNFTALLLLLLFSQITFAANQKIELEDVFGKKHLFSDYIGKGKWVVLNVWATACPYCRKELDALIDFHEHHQNDAIVIGLTVDWPSFGFPEKEDLYYFVLDYLIEYPVLMVDKELANQLIDSPVDMIPLTFFYNPEGKLVYRLNGVVTAEMLETVIKRESSDYEIKWAEEVPPVFRP